MENINKSIQKDMENYGEPRKILKVEENNIFLQPLQKRRDLKSVHLVEYLLRIYGQHILAVKARDGLAGEGACC